MSGIVLGARGSGSPELASTTSWGLLEATGRRFRVRQAHRSARAARRHVPVRGRGVLSQAMGAVMIASRASCARAA